MTERKREVVLATFTAIHWRMQVAQLAAIEESRRQEEERDRIRQEEEITKLRAEAKRKVIQLEEEETPRNQFSMTIRIPFEREN